MAADDDPLVPLLTQGDPPARYVWSVRRSVIYKLPQWDPLTVEIPLSPHKAVLAAREYLQRQYGPLVSFRLLSFSVETRDILNKKNDDYPEVWAYTILFESDSHPNLDGNSELELMVLLNGQVIAPVREQP